MDTPLTVTGQGDYINVCVGLPGGGTRTERGDDATLRRIIGQERAAGRTEQESQHREESKAIKAAQDAAERAALWMAVERLEAEGMHKAAECVRRLIPPVPASAFVAPRCESCNETMVWSPPTRHVPEMRDPPTPEEKARPGVWYCPVCLANKERP